MEIGIVIRATNVGKEIATADGPLQILHGVDLQLLMGASVAVVGASGSGKSTLLGLLAGLDLPSEGSIELLARNIISMDEDGRARLRAEEPSKLQEP